MIGYDALRAEQAAARAEGRLLGIGLGLYVEPSGLAMGNMASEGAMVSIGVNGQVQALMSSGNHGQSLETTVAQVIADRLGVDVDDVTVIQGDTASAPFGPGTGGSRSAVILSGAADAAAGRVRAKVLEIAAHHLEAAVEDLEIEDGRIAVVGTPAKATSITEVARLAYLNPAGLPRGMEMGLEEKARYTPSAPFTWSNSCHACLCEVDPRTGQVTLLRYVVSEDCGVMINPDVVEGQIAGGVVQGIGGVLYEHMVYDDAGNPQSTTFVDYLLPTAAEVPIIEYGHIETPASTNPGGHKGMGEGGAIGSPPAVINAVADAVAHLGARLTAQPLTPMAILAAIDDGGRRQRMTETNRRLLLRERPTGEVGAEHFELVETSIPEPGDGEVLLRTRWLSFDPAQRGRLNDVRSYVPPVALGAVMEADGIGEVVASKAPGVEVGQLVHAEVGWQDYVVVDPADRDRFEPVPDDVDEPHHMLGLLGMTGLTAYFGMTDIGRPVEGDAVVVTAAAGATGSIAGQIARIKGASQVIGTAGSAAKRDWVRDVAGFDDCLDHYADDVLRQLRAANRDGYQVVFDNVGGDAARRLPVQHRRAGAGRAVRLDLHRLQAAAARRRDLLLPAAHDAPQPDGGLPRHRLRRPLRRGPSRPADVGRRGPPAPAVRRPRRPRVGTPRPRPPLRRRQPRQAARPAVAGGSGVRASAWCPDGCSTATSPGDGSRIGRRACIRTIRPEAWPAAAATRRRPGPRGPGRRAGSGGVGR